MIPRTQVRIPAMVVCADNPSAQEAGTAGSLGFVPKVDLWPSNIYPHTQIQTH